MEVLEFFALLDKLYDLDSVSTVDQRMEAAGKLIQDNAHATHQNQEAIGELTASVQDVRHSVDALRDSFLHNSRTDIVVYGVMLVLIIAMAAAFIRAERRMDRLQKALEVNRGGNA